MMRVDVDDQEILIAALHRLLGCVGQRLSCVVVLDRHIAQRDRANIVGLGIHGSPPAPLQIFT
jgi:hypothetical protein